MRKFKFFSMLMMLIAVILVTSADSNANCPKKTDSYKVEGTYLGWVPGGEFDEVCIKQLDGQKFCVNTDADKETVDAAFGKPGQKVMMYFDFRQWASGNSCVKMNVLIKVDQLK